MPVTPDLWEGSPWVPRKWQREALPEIIAHAKAGKKAIVSATPGAGKSALIAHLAYMAMRKAGGRAIVIVTPTKKLVRQLHETVALWCGAENVGQYYSERKQPSRRVVIVCNPSLPSMRLEFASQGREVALMICDEVHGTEGPEVKAAIQAIAATTIIGMTGTPFRSDKSESLELWDSVSFKYSLGAALRDGVLVPWRTVNWTGRDGAPTDDVCVQLIRERAHGPGVVSATSIEDAEEYAARLTREGIRAEAIHSKLTGAAQADLLDRLQGEQLRALVHVSMLSEGVDMPWLRWLCLRRPVGARVRFVQESMRVLRCHEGKDHAVIIDPHDLFGAFGVAHSPEVGEKDAPDDLMPYQETLGLCEDEIDPEAGLPIDVQMPGAKAVALATQWSRQLLLSLQAHGLAEAGQVPDGRWRTRPASAKQVGALSRMVWASRYLPKEHRETVKALVKNSTPLQRGAVSDLIDVLRAVATASEADRKRRRHWKWPRGVVVEPIHPGAVGALPQMAME